MARTLHIVIACFVALALAGCGRPAVPFTHDAYIWQRQWTPALRESVAASRDLVHAWRVLLAQVARDGRLQAFAPDREALAASGRPVVLVVRIDGRLDRFDGDALRERIAQLARQWPGAAGIEIDYDCPTARLPAYTAFLAQLKPALGDTPLSITALPTWLGSPALDGLLAVPDASVVQVHAVQAPQAGLFDPAVAAGWVRRFASHTRKPFRVALPTYASRVSWNADGSLLAVESEKAALAGGAGASELYAAPGTVLGFVRELQAARVPHLEGIVWFRLPTADDSRAWSLATWRGVVAGHLDDAPLRLRLRDAGDGARDVVLENTAGTDATAPLRVDLPAGCALADGIDGYRLAKAGATLSLVTTQARPVPSHATRAIGWARCSAGTLTTMTLPGIPVS